MVWNSEYDKVNGYASTEDLSDGQSRLVRLVEDPEIVKNITFDEVSFKIDEPKNIAGDEKQVSGYICPVIRINDYIFEATEIQNLTINSSSFIPTISLSVNPSSAKFRNINAPKDGDIISVYMRSNNTGLNYLRNDFVITSCAYSVKDDKAPRVISLTGKMFIYGFESSKIPFAFIGTSKDVMKQLARKYSLGFAYNDCDDTDDYQLWISLNGGTDFAGEVTKHAWKDNRSFFSSWIDLYYNVCFVNVDKFLDSGQNPEDEIDITYRTNTFELSRIVAQNNDNDKENTVLKFLTNSTAYRGGPFYIKAWRPINNSTMVSMNAGYTRQTYTYLHNQKILNSSPELCFESLSTQATFDENKKDTHIQLRGRARYEKDKAAADEQARVNYRNVDEYVRKEWCGVQYVRSKDDDESQSTDGWSGNTHRNYMLAAAHNYMNLAELDKMYIEVDVEGLCLQVMRGERVPVMIEYKNEAEKMHMQQGAPENESDVNKMYSGYYIVDSIAYTYKRERGVTSGYTTHMVLRRKEWPAPVTVSKDTVSDTGTPNLEV